MSSELRMARQSLVRNGMAGFASLGVPTNPVSDISGAVYAAALTMAPLVIRSFPLPSRLDTVRDAFVLLQDLEEQSLATANLYIARHNSGRMLTEEYAEYDGMRHDLHDAQVKYYRALRQACYDTLGGTVGQATINRVPWPGWLPRLEGQVSRVSQSSLGVAPIFIAAVAIGVIGAIALLVHQVGYFLEASTDAYVAQAQASTLQRAMEMRERVYQQCLAAGEPPAACTARSIALTGDLAALIREIGNRRRASRLKRVLPAVLGGLVLTAIISGVVYYRRKKAGKPSIFARFKSSGTSGTSGMRGLGRAKSRRPRKRRRSARAKGLGGPTRLTSLGDKVPSRYMLEV